MLRARDFEPKIDAYFDDEMSLEQEAAFMQELDTNPALRKLFENELTIRTALGGISADEAAKNNLKADLGYNPLHVKKKQASVIFLQPAFRVAAAAVILAAVVVTVLFMLNRKNTQSSSLANNQQNPALKIDSAKTNLQTPNPQILASDTYKKYYHTYNSDNDPVEVSYYYSQLKKGNYTAVLKATPADLQQMGANDNTDQLNQYLQLYKGLAFLAQDNAKGAMDKFEGVLAKAGSTTPQYYTAQWYACLAYLKLNQANKSDSITGVITNGSSPYKTQAQGLRQALTGK